MIYRIDLSDQGTSEAEEAWVYVWVLHTRWECEGGPVSQNNGISGAFILFWAPAGQQAQAKCFQETTEIFRSLEEDQFESRHKQKLLFLVE